MLSGEVPPPPPPTPGPKLSSWAGLVEAGIVEAVHFDPFTGAVDVVYARDYLRVLRSLELLVVDPEIVGAVLIDDPIAFRNAIARALARSGSDSAPTESGVG